VASFVHARPPAPAGFAITSCMRLGVPCTNPSNVCVVGKGVHHNKGPPYRNPLPAWTPPPWALPSKYFLQRLPLESPRTSAAAPCAALSEFHGSWCYTWNTSSVKCLTTLPMPCGTQPSGQTRIVCCLCSKTDNMAHADVGRTTVPGSNWMARRVQTCSSVENVSAWLLALVRRVP
jgi:hypothetical protein